MVEGPVAALNCHHSCNVRKRDIYIYTMLIALVTICCLLCLVATTPERKLSRQNKILFGVGGSGSEASLHMHAVACLGYII